MNKEHIVFRFVNTKQNAGWLNKVPHREFYDLSIVYYQIQDNMQYADLIGNQVAADNNVDEEALYQLALKNTKRIFPTEVLPMSEMNLSGRKEVNESETERKEMYCLSNQYGRHGAISILDNNALDKIAKIEESDLYLLPSSIHEFVAVSVDAVPSLEFIQERVHFINQHFVSETDRLSNEVYHYNRQTQTITQATHGSDFGLNEVRKDWSESTLEYGRSLEIDVDIYEQQNVDMQLGM